jgi:nitric oxide reductase large subunit
VSLIEAQMFARWCGKYLLIGVAVMLVVGLLPIGRDDTDPGAWGARSGLVPSTDALTGCQYLRTSGGGITPRMTSDGKHLGCSR